MDLLRQARPELKGLTLQHRLDLETSGLILFTIGDSLRAAVAQKFAQGEIKKEYLCWVRGKKLAKRWTVEVPLGERSGRVYLGEGKSARTDFLLLKRVGPYCLLKALPLTGRKHQIRAHLAHAKLPILGDVLFGGESSHRLLLHASSLGFCLDGRREFRWTVAFDQDFLPNIGGSEGG